MAAILSGKKISTPPYVATDGILTHTIAITNIGDQRSEGLTLVEHAPHGTDFIDRSAAFFIDGTSITGTQKRLAKDPDYGFILEVAPRIQLEPGKTLVITYKTRLLDLEAYKESLAASADHHTEATATNSENFFQGGFEEKVAIPPFGVFPIVPTAQKGSSITAYSHKLQSPRPAPIDYAWPLLLQAGTYEVSYSALPLYGQREVVTIGIALHGKELRTGTTTAKLSDSKKTPLRCSFPLLVASGQCQLTLINLGATTFFREIRLTVVKLD